MICGLRNDKELFTVVYDIATRIFGVKLGGELARYRLQPGGVLGSTITQGMEGIIRLTVSPASCKIDCTFRNPRFIQLLPVVIQGWVYFSGELFEDQNATWGKGIRFNEINPRCKKAYVRILKDVKASRAASLSMDEDVASAEGIRFAYDKVDSDDDNVRTYPNKKSRLSDRAQKMATFASEAVI